MSRLLPIALTVLFACASSTFGQETSPEHKEIQGNWALDQTESSFGAEEYRQQFAVLRLDLTRNLDEISIQGSKIGFADFMADYSIEFLNEESELASQLSEQGRKLVTVGYCKGKLKGTLKVSGDVLEFRFPETCQCTRTGSILIFNRKSSTREQPYPLN